MTLPWKGVSLIWKGPIAFLVFGTCSSESALLDPMEWSAEKGIRRSRNTFVSQGACTSLPCMFSLTLLTTKNNLKASLEETKTLKECCTVARIVFDAKLILEQDLYDLVGLISTGLSRDLSNYRCKTKSKFNKHVICSYVAVFKSFRVDLKSWNFPVSWLNFI